jgi:hypothetical protein
MRNVSGRLAIFTFVVSGLVTGWALSAYRPGDRALAADGVKPGLTTGQACKVYLRADAAGTSGQYVPNLTNNATLSGKVAAVDDQWLVLSAEKAEYHIPRAAVLAIEVGK